MTVKRFFGDSAREALRKVKEELGTEAIVISNKSVLAALKSWRCLRTASKPCRVLSASQGRPCPRRRSGRPRRIRLPSLSPRSLVARLAPSRQRRLFTPRMTRTTTRSRCRPRRGRRRPSSPGSRGSQRVRKPNLHLPRNLHAEKNEAAAPVAAKNAACGAAAESRTGGGYACAGWAGHAERSAARHARRSRPGV